MCSYIEIKPGTGKLLVPKRIVSDVVDRGLGTCAAVEARCERSGTLGTGPEGIDLIILAGFFDLQLYACHS